MKDDLIKRSDAAEVVYKALKTPPLKGVMTDTMSLAIALVRDIPSADRPQDTMDEWTGTLTLTEASGNELMRVLKEQDTAFMNDLFDGRCGVILRCADGRSVKLIPWVRKWGYWREVYRRKGPHGPERTLECCNCQKRRVIKIGEAFPAYCEHCGSFKSSVLT